MMVMVSNVMKAENTNEIDYKADTWYGQECSTGVYTLWFEDPMDALTQNIKCSEY